jgi:hypothetical protein
VFRCPRCQANAFCRCKEWMFNFYKWSALGCCCVSSDQRNWERNCEHHYVYVYIIYIYFLMVVSHRVLVFGPCHAMWLSFADSFFFFHLFQSPVTSCDLQRGARMATALRRHILVFAASFEALATGHVAEQKVSGGPEDRFERM